MKFDNIDKIDLSMYLYSCGIDMSINDVLIYNKISITEGIKHKSKCLTLQYI